ncbi:MAG: LysM peptidoglycan-binding domain-containing protein [Nanoarchaeota archaeon]|nr:LysM peptidoglycan-binding domain-containing protein [Nanoarchaeota archaeon]
MKKILILAVTTALFLTCFVLVLHAQGVSDMFVTFGKQIIVSTVKPVGELMKVSQLTGALTSGSIAMSELIKVPGVLNNVVGEKAATAINQVESLKNMMPAGTEVTGKILEETGRVESLVLKDITLSEYAQRTVEIQGVPEIKVDEATGETTYTLDGKSSVSMRTLVEGKEETVIYQNLKGKMVLDKNGLVESMDVTAEANTIVKVGGKEFKLSPGDKLAYDKKSDSCKISSKEGFDYCKKEAGCKPEESYKIIGDVEIIGDTIKGKDFRLNNYNFLGEGEAKILNEGVLLKNGVVEKTGFGKIKPLDAEGVLLREGNSFAPDFKNQVVFDKDKSLLKGVVDVKDGLYVSNSYEAQAELFYKDNNVKLKNIGEGTVKVRLSNGKEIVYSMSKAEKYVVQKGDTISKIAAEKGVSMDDLLKANPQVKDKNKIFVGQELAIPAVMQAKTSRAEDLEGKEGAKSIDTKEIDNSINYVNKEGNLEVQAKQTSTVYKTGPTTPKKAIVYYDNAVLKGEAVMHDRIETAAKKAGLTQEETDEFRSIVAVETAYNPNQLMSYKRDRKGNFILDNNGNKIIDSVGYAQINEITVAEFNKKMRKDYTMEGMLKDPDKNLEVGTWYWKQMKQRTGGDTNYALLAYQHGPTGASKISAQKRATQPYVIKVMHYYDLFASK